MDTTVVIAIAVVAVLAMALIVVRLMGMNRKKQIKEQFGAEYERTVMMHEGKDSEAAKELAERQKRVESLKLKELEPQQREHFGDEWRLVQTRFVDSPEAAIEEADGLVQKVMDARGYPLTNFEQQAADLSVDHADVVSNYRKAHAIATAREQGQATTEDLRQAFIYYRAIFADLLGSTPARV
jgi:predicted metalloendopeptidase